MCHATVVFQFSQEHKILQNYVMRRKGKKKQKDVILCDKGLRQSKINMKAYFSKSRVFILFIFFRGEKKNSSYWRYQEQINFLRPSEHFSQKIVNPSHTFNSTSRTEFFWVFYHQIIAYLFFLNSIEICVIILAISYR